MTAIEGAGAARGETVRTGTGRIVLASLVGTRIEFYDFYIFGTAAALVFRRHVLPQVGAVFLLAGYMVDASGRARGRSLLLLLRLWTQGRCGDECRRRLCALQIEGDDSRLL